MLPCPTLVPTEETGAVAREASVSGVASVVDMLGKVRIAMDASAGTSGCRGVSRAMRFVVGDSAAEGGGLGRLPSRKRRSGFGTGVGGVRGIDGSDFGNTTCRARVPEYLNR